MKKTQFWAILDEEGEILENSVPLIFSSRALAQEYKSFNFEGSGYKVSKVSIDIEVKKDKKRAKNSTR